MPTHAPERASLGSAVHEVAEHASTLARLELRLALLELKQKLVALGVGIGLGVGAAILALFGLGFGLATAAAALGTTVSMWLALLIVAGALVGLAGMLGLMALRTLRRGVPPVPQQAIREAKLTTEAVRANGGRSA
jgi:hypothetical protein